MSAIAYCEEAFALLRANLAAELATIQDANTALVHILNDPESNRGAALDQARVVAKAITDAAVGYEPTVEQVRQAGKPSHPPTPKPVISEEQPPNTGDADPIRTVTVKAAPKKK